MVKLRFGLRLSEFKFVLGLDVWNGQECKMQLKEIVNKDAKLSFGFLSKGVFEELLKVLGQKGRFQWFEE